MIKNIYTILESTFLIIVGLILMYWGWAQFDNAVTAIPFFRGLIIIVIGGAGINIGTNQLKKYRSRAQ